MKLILIGLILCGAAIGQTITTATDTINPQDYQLKCSDFCVEKLSDAEIARLAEAKKKLAIAQGAYDSVLSSVREAHGQPAVSSIQFCWPYDTVEIRGKYALITYNANRCVSW